MTSRANFELAINFSLFFFQNGGQTLKIAVRKYHVKSVPHRVCRSVYVFFKLPYVASIIIGKKNILPYPFNKHKTYQTSSEVLLEVCVGEQG